MPKARDLAALAGLAGLAYAMRDKGMTPEQNDTLANVNKVSKMSENSDTLARMDREKTPGQGMVDDTNAGVLNTITAPKKMEDTSNYSNEGRNKPPKAFAPIASAKPTSVKPRNVVTGSDLPPASSDQLSGLSKTIKRESKTKQFAQDTPEELSAQKTDALAVSSRAARAADARRRMVKQSSYKSGGMTSSASSRADGIATKGKTRGKIC